MTDTFIDVLQREIASIQTCSVEPEDDSELQDTDYLVERWQRKVRWCSSGEMKWAHFYAMLP